MTRQDPEEVKDPLLGEAQLLPAPGDAVRQALRRYLMWSLLAVLVVSLASVLLSVMIARREAIRDAEASARAVANALVVPLADRGFHSRNPAALARMTQALGDRARDGSISHIKIWGDAGDGHGTVLWADERALVGSTFQMDPEEYALFGTTGTVSEISHLRKDENALERAEGQLVEVYTGVVDSADVPVLFESYVTTEGLDENARSLFRAILPLSLGAVVVLALATLPLATSLATRVDRGQQQMKRLLLNALASSDLERRRVARNLHDGVIQDLAGIGYALSAQVRRLPAGPERDELDQVRGILARDVAMLRTLMMDIYPPELDEGRLASALRDLVQHSDFAGATVTVDVEEGLAPTPLGARVAYRLIREVLRNSMLHAKATRVSVRVGQVGDHLEFEVVDDGIGFDPLQGSPEGHLGLRLVREMAADAGGRLTIESVPGQGTRVQAILPM